MEDTLNSNISIWLESSKSQIQENVPFGSEADIGRRVLNKSTTGWGAIGVCIGFKEMKEARTLPGPAVEGEIGDTTPNLHHANIADKWEIMYGNGKCAEVGVADFVYGLQMFQKMIGTSELRQSCGITDDMLEPNVVPPHLAQLPKDKIVQKPNGKRASSALSLVSTSVEELKCCVCNKLFKSAAGLKYHRMNVCVSEEAMAARNQLQMEKASISAENASALPLKRARRPIQAAVVCSDDETSDDGGRQRDADFAVDEAVSDDSASVEGEKKRSRSATNRLLGPKDRKATPAKSKYSGPSRGSGITSPYEHCKGKWMSEPLYNWATLFKPPRFSLVVGETGALVSRLWVDARNSIDEMIRAWRIDADQQLLPFTVKEEAGEALLNPWSSIRRDSKHGGAPSSQPAGRLNRDELCRFDFLLNCCGAVWDCAFAPSSHVQEPSLHRHLVIGTSRIGWLDSSSMHKSIGVPSRVGSDLPSVLGSSYEHPNLLQVLEIMSDLESSGGSIVRNEQDLSTSSSTAASCRLSYLVGLPRRGACWKLFWAPFASIEDVRLLGVLAVVCGDGSCIVLVLPRVDNANSHDTLKVIPESSLCRWVVRVPNNNIISASWNIHTKWELLCGMKDGSITVWDLNPSAEAPDCSFPILLNTPKKSFVDSSVDRSTASVAAVTTVKVCPYHPQLFLSAGYDGSVKIWNVDDCFRPLYVRKHLVGWINDVEWDVCGLGLAIAGSDTSTINLDSLWSNPAVRRVGLYSHVDKLSACWKARSFKFDSQSVTCSVSSDGSARYGIVSQLMPKTRPSIWELMKVQSVEPRAALIPQSDSRAAICVDRVNVSFDSIVDPSEGGVSPASSFRGIGLHTIDVCSVDANLHLIACGGATGLVRLVCRDLKKGIIM